MEEQNSADSPVYDVAVVGAGFVGSWTAYHLAKGGKRTVLIDQFSLPHARGSSCGYQRGEATLGLVASPYVKLLEYSIRLLRDLERSSGEKLSYVTGQVVADTSPSAAVQSMAQLATAHGVDHERLGGTQLAQRFPDWVQFGDETEAVYVKDSRIYRCDYMLRILWDTFKQDGGTIKDIHSVRALESDENGGPVKILTSAGMVLARSVVLAVGAWSGRLLSSLGLHLHVPLEVVVMNMMYYKEKTRGQYAIETGFPRWLLLGCKPPGRFKGVSGIWLHPSFDYPGYLMVNVPEDTTIDPEEPAAILGLVPSPEVLTATNTTIASRFPGVQPSPSVVNTAMLTFTPDEIFIIDRHPKFGNIVFAAGLCGMGFTMGPAVGKALCDLVLRQPPSFDLAPFKMSRFQDAGSVSRL